MAPFSHSGFDLNYIINWQIMRIHNQLQNLIIGFVGLVNDWLNSDYLHLPASVCLSKNGIQFLFGQSERKRHTCSANPV